MAHTIIIIDSVTPPSPTATAEAEEPSCKVRVEYRPEHGLTASQIGNEVARIKRKVDQIIEGTAD